MPPMPTLKKHKLQTKDFPNPLVTKLSLLSSNNKQSTWWALPTLQNYKTLVTNRSLVTKGYLSPQRIFIQDFLAFVFVLFLGNNAIINILF